MAYRHGRADDWGIRFRRRHRGTNPRDLSHSAPAGFRGRLAICAFTLWFASHDADKAFDDLEKSKAEAITDGTLDTWKANLESDTDFAALCAAAPARKQALLA